MDELAPLVNMIILIIKDIRWFLAIFLVCGFSFSICFTLIAKNQMEDLAEDPDFDSMDELSLPSYRHLNGAIQHVFLLALGSFSVLEYELGGGKWSIYFMTIFSTAAFLLVFHFLHMLIAIMQETFDRNSERKRKQQIQSHLMFVLETLYMDPIRQKDRITYLISAFVNEEENQEMEQLKHIENMVT